MKKTNFSSIIRQELVKRFDGVVQEEIKKTQKYIDYTRSIISIIKEKQDEQQKDFIKFLRILEDFEKKFEKKFEVKISQIEENFETQRKYIRKNNSHIEEFKNFFEEKCRKFIDYSVFNTFRNELNSVHNSIYEYIKSETRSFIKLFSEREKAYDHSRESIKKEFESLKRNLNEELICLQEKNNIYLIEIEGFRRENEILKKSLFIIEKKIENIYTLIERMKKEEDA